IIEPYKTPDQYAKCGTGFFINEDGDILTNAHVVNGARRICIQVPQLGKIPLSARIIGISPELDVALLRVEQFGLDILHKELGGTLPYLSLGDSDLVGRSDEVLALGYPLGQQSLKSTSGMVSGREGDMIQISAPINPGNSGGPLLNVRGEVIGINTANVPGAQNVGYSIPINSVRTLLPDLYKGGLVRRPFLGIVFGNATEALVRFLGNPLPGGCYVVEVIPNSTSAKAGIKSGDMIYEVNGQSLDLYGDMRVPWSEDKIALTHFMHRLSLGDRIEIILYRQGKRMKIDVTYTEVKLPPIRRLYTAYEPVDYEVIGGMVVMPLSLNHVQALFSHAPGLSRYIEMKNHTRSTLVITHIIPGSHIHKCRVLSSGYTINEVNGIAVETLEDFRNAVRAGLGSPFLTIRATDNISRSSDNVVAVFEYDVLVEEEGGLSHDYHYNTTPLMKTVIEHVIAQGNSKT
ncbi:MAG: trypsin-like peptidase domain-containing protein, partial [Candidatus Babeliales bacterium]